MFIHNMYMYIYIHTYIYTYICLYIYIYVYIHVLQMYTYIYLYIYREREICSLCHIYIYMYTYSSERERERLICPLANRELEYRIPTLHSPVDSRWSPETFGDSCRNKKDFLWVSCETVFSCLLRDGCLAHPVRFFQQGKNKSTFDSIKHTHLRRKRSRASTANVSGNKHNYFSSNRSQ